MYRITLYAEFVHELLGKGSDVLPLRIDALLCGKVLSIPVTQNPFRGLYKIGRALALECGADGSRKCPLFLRFRTEFLLYTPTKLVVY